MAADPRYFASGSLRMIGFPPDRAVLGGWCGGQFPGISRTSSSAMPMQITKPLGSAIEYGWVTTLAHNLNTGPNHYRKTCSSTIVSSRVMYSATSRTKVKEAPSSLLFALSKLYRLQLVRFGTGPFHPTHANDPEKPTDVFVSRTLPLRHIRKRPSPAFTSCANASSMRSSGSQRPMPASPLLAGDPSPHKE